MYVQYSSQYVQIAQASYSTVLNLQGRDLLTFEIIIIIITYSKLVEKVSLTER